MKRIIAIIALAAATNAMAQDAFGGMGPKTSQNTTKPATKKYNMPDKPNVTDAQGRKQGEWAKKYENGRYIYVATFVDDKPVGKVTRYAENGKKSSEMNYGANGRVDAVFYHDNGNIASKGLYINRQREGEWSYYDEGKRLVAKESYTKGILNGKSYTFFEGGELSDETTYKMGVLEGDWIQYFKSGRHRLEARYTHGKLNGLYRYWDDGGSLSVEGMYEMGVQVGDWKIYEDNDSKTYFVMEYDKNGKLLNEEEVQARMNKKLEIIENNRKNIEDPQDYINHPEDYRPY